MVYQSDKMTYTGVMKVFSGKVNDVEICESTANGRSTYYTVLIIKERETVRRLIRIMEEHKTDAEYCIDLFDSNRGFCVVLNYVKERRLADFFMSRDMPLATCEEICLNLVVQCMTSGLPWPLLELILRQKQIQLLKDNCIALSYALDLQELREECSEADCVMECSLIVRDMLGKKMSPKNIGYKLLVKKIPRQSYVSFRELYKDIRLATSTARKKGLFSGLKAFLIRNSGAIFRLLLVICLILTVSALIIWISRIIWGDVPLLRLFYNTFKKIGTESLID